MLQGCKSVNASSHQCLRIAPLGPRSRYGLLVLLLVRVIIRDFQAHNLAQAAIQLLFPHLGRHVWRLGLQESQATAVTCQASESSKATHMCSRHIQQLAVRTGRHHCEEMGLSGGASCLSMRGEYLCIRLVLYCAAHVGEVRGTQLAHIRGHTQLLEPPCAHVRPERVLHLALPRCVQEPHQHTGALIVDLETLALRAHMARHTAHSLHGSAQVQGKPPCRAEVPNGIHMSVIRPHE